MSYSPEERDLAIRTILAEAGSQGVEGQLAVANVIRNRVASGNYGDGLGGVVTKKYAFEPMLHYGTGQGNDPARFNEGDPAYQQAARILDTTLAGGAPDNTGGATHFIAHRLQGDMGRDTPTWAKGAPLAQIGGHSFYAPEGKIKMDDSTLDPNLVAKLAASSTNNAGQQAAQMFQNRNGGAPAGPATQGQFGPLADMFKKMGQGGGQAAPGGDTPFLQRMLWGDKGFNGVLGGIKTPNDGQGMFGSMFGGAPPSTPPGGPAPQPPGVGAGGTGSLTVPPVTPVEVAPLPPPVAAAPVVSEAPAIAAPMVSEAAAPAVAAAAAPVAEAAAAPALAAAAAPAAAAAVPAAAAGAEGLASLASLFALI